jgi:hypothetical protein
VPLRGTAGARHGRGARPFLGGRRSAAPAEQPERSGGRLQPAPRTPFLLPAGGGVLVGESPRKPQRIVFGIIQLQIHELRSFYVVRNELQ